MLNRTHSAYNKNMTTPTPQEVARAIVRAQTLQELEDARVMRETYLAVHPNDEDIAAMGDTLDALAVALKPASDPARDSKPHN